MTAPRTLALLSDEPGRLRDRLAAAGRVVVLPLDRLGDEHRRELEAADCAVVDAPTQAAISALRRLHAAAPALQVLLAVRGEERAQVERALLFAPGLGEVWLTGPDELDAARIEQAAGVTGQRRRYRATRRRVEEDLSAVESQRTRRALISDAYLAALLQVLPQPVLSIDADGCILSWNPAAEAFFGLPTAEAVGREVLDVLEAEEPAGLERTLEAGARSVHRSETAFLAAGERRVAEVTVAPVHAAGRGVRSLVLHDVTATRRQTEELARQRERLEEQTSELARLNGDLRQGSRELEEALAARSRFYTSMSHELRTPMNAIIGYNSLLLEEVFGPLEGKQAEALRKSQRAAEHLLELVNDVLDLAKIEAGRTEILLEHAHFPELLTDLLDTVRPLAEERGSELTLEGPEESCTLVTDPRRVRQILLNLLSNAIKFGEGRPIELAWRILPDGGVGIDVTDHGRGIDVENVHRIFDEFVQVEARQPGGTGLGLAISRRLAEVLGGTLDVHSVREEGSIFCLTLPAEIPMDAVAGMPEG